MGLNYFDRIRIVFKGYPCEEEKVEVIENVTLVEVIAGELLIRSEETNSYYTYPFNDIKEVVFEC